MAGLPRTGPTPLALALPEEIFGLEILVRLPSKDLVRCRAVCRAWRHVASTRDLLLAHHRRRPSLPLVLLSKHDSSLDPDLYSFDYRGATGGGEARLQLVARTTDSAAIGVAASCDGLLLLSVCIFFPFIKCHLICNPTTRQTARVPEIDGFKATGLYRHLPTGEYRLLLHTRSEELVHGVKDPCYVFALGCSNNQPRPRCIGRTPELSGFFGAPVLIRGSLHWSWWPAPVTDKTGRRITVFDTTAESFRLIHSPLVQKSRSFLYDEGGGTLGTYSYSDDSLTAVDIWVLQDYDSEVWSRKYHVKLPVAEISSDDLDPRSVMVIHDERGVFVLYSSGHGLFLVDTGGTLLASLQLDDAYVIFPSTQRIKESLVQHSFFSAPEGPPLDEDWSSISWMERGV